jgi:hypothetical protein
VLDSKVVITYDYEGMESILVMLHRVLCSTCSRCVDTVQFSKKITQQKVACDCSMYTLGHAEGYIRGESAHEGSMATRRKRMVLLLTSDLPPLVSVLNVTSSILLSQ